MKESIFLTSAQETQEQIKDEWTELEMSQLPKSASDFIEDFKELNGNTKQKMSFLK